MAMVDLKELENELQATRACVESWASMRTESAQATRDAHLHTLQDQSAKLNSLKTRHASLGAAALQVKQKLHMEETEKSALQTATAAAHEEQLSVHKTVSTYKELLEQKEIEFVMLEQASKMDEGVKRKKMDALRKALALYSSRLGLDFKQGKDELQLVFTQIDASQPSRPFLLAVKVHEDKTYEVTSCEPKIPGLPELVAQLNKSSDFSAFVKSIREAFKRAV